jgi:hypothetical protein
MNVEMIEPTPATTEQPAPQPTQGVFMDNLQAPNLVGIIMQALESHITALVDKRLNERCLITRLEALEMNRINGMDDIKDTVTEMVDEKMSDMHSEINDMIDEKISDHQSEYDHDEYDTTVRTVNDAELDDIEEKIKHVLRGIRFEANFY